ncbi:hypothetical protein AMTR_s00144p00107300 [Amborella trichopoda]|uniref:Uncharacterized protein n=1 Tax=Amborella trichopoda TaxID=13333 RepID=W1P703_AMBTC|nr:hypothetical protein AMTR_s00144p00107300 [Amborella trichopoda]
MSSIAERKALANACKSEEWSKAIRILDSIISKSFSAQDLWYILFSSYFLLSLSTMYLMVFALESAVLALWELSLCGFLPFFGVSSNRAFCYRQLELHKHTIKDCDKAIELNPTLLQAFILKVYECGACAATQVFRIYNVFTKCEYGAL